MFLTLEVYGDFFTKAGGVRKVDLDNCLKNIQDSIFPVLGLDDSLVFGISLKKIHATDNYKVKVIIEERPYEAG